MVKENNNMPKNTIKNAKEYNKKARAKYNAEYTKEMRKSYMIVCNNKTDISIIDKLNSVSNKNDYIRQLILADIRNNDKKI